jgi:membrane-associated protease RseP (regulator of RpoE activity)
MLRLALIFLLALAACEGDTPASALLSLESSEMPGLGLRELPDRTLRSIGLAYGLAVVRVGTAAERAGLRLGDVIYGVNQTKIHSVAEFSQLVAAPDQPGPLGLLVRRGKTDFYVPMDVAPGAPRPPDAPPRRMRPSTDTLLRT